MQFVPLRISKEYNLGDMDFLIHCLEREIGFSLPADYKAFLKATNGGMPERTCEFYVDNLGQGTLLHILLGIFKRHNWADLEYQWREYMDDLPEHSIIIGNDQGGNFLVLLAEPEDVGVYYWDHKHFFPQSMDEQDLYFLAGTFSDFVDSLKVYPRVEEQ